MPDTPIKGIYSIINGQRVLINPMTSISAVSGLTDELTSITNSVSTLTASLQQLNTQVTTIGSANSTNANNITTANSNISNLQSSISSISSQLETIAGTLAEYSSLINQINSVTMNLFHVGSDLTDLTPEYLEENVIRVTNIFGDSPVTISPAYSPMMENYFCYNSFSASVMLRFELLINMTSDFQFGFDNQNIQAMAGNGFYVLPVHLADEIETLNGNAFYGHLPIYAESESSSSSAMYVNGQQIASAFFWGNLILVSAPLTAGKYWIQGTLMSAPEDEILNNGAGVLVHMDSGENE